MQVQATIDRQEIVDAFEQNYDGRNLEQHQIAINVILAVMPNFSKEEARVVSMFVGLLSKNNPDAKQKITINSTVIQYIDGTLKCQIVKSSMQVNQINLQDLTLVFEDRHRNSVRNIRTIQQQIKFLQNNKYCKQMFKKSLFFLLKNVQYVNYRFGESVYQEDDEIPEGQTYVYMVRTGQFCYKKRIDNQAPMMLYQFGPGTIFGNQSQQNQRKRQLSVSCRSSKGVLLRFTQDFFNSFMKRQCQMLLQMNKVKIDDFLDNRMRETKANRFKNQDLMAKTKRINTLQNTLLTAPTLSSSRTFFSSISFPKLRSFQKLPSLSPKPQSKSVAKPQLIQLSSPEYQEQALILNKKAKCSKIREIVSRKDVPGRGEILMHLMKTSWKFDKNKHRKALF